MGHLENLCAAVGKLNCFRLLGFHHIFGPAAIVLLTVVTCPSFLPFSVRCCPCVIADFSIFLGESARFLRFVAFPVRSLSFVNFDLSTERHSNEISQLHSKQANTAHTANTHPTNTRTTNTLSHTLW